jgi:uncharacterized membrane protein YphA (DoxX/SURF4 family)
MKIWERLLHNDYLTLLIRVAVGLIFIYASLDKITNPAQFARIVYNYHLISGPLINIFALLLPWVEVIAGISLILGLYRQGGILIANLMVISFIIALGINLIRGVDLECGCFTVSSKARGNVLGLIIRDFGLLILTGYLFFSRSAKFNLMRS